MRQAALGAYGLAIDGLAAAEQWMQAVPDSSPQLLVETSRQARGDTRTSRLDATRADLRLVAGGRLRMRRGDGRARFSFPEIPADPDLLHPYLAPAAALAHMWSGHEALHGGAFLAARGAVAVLAEKDGGKSTTLAWLTAEHGTPVLSDDLVVLTDGDVPSGPRCIDLRTSGLIDHASFDSGRVVRRTERLRISLPGAPSRAQLIATVVLRWGTRTQLEAPVPADRLRQLLPHRMYHHHLAGDPRAILDMASLPMLILTRRRGKPGLRETTTLLTDYF